jgi:pyruvate/2-oxoglutarate dehydrogenase complex dihydrolipoamide acyltransferase (E2) component
VTIDVLMPVITEAGDDGVVTAWFVDEGSAVAEGRLIAEVQAEKVSDDVLAPGDGVLRDLVPVNQPVPQGQRICVIDTEAVTDALPAAGAPAPAAKGERRIVASPAAKRVARELGVDLSLLAGTGPGGRITEDDVRAAGGPPEPGVALTGLRAVIARNMRASGRDAAPVTLTTQADVTESAADHLTAWIVHAAARALEGHPALNGTREGDRFIPGDDVDVALAVQTDEGLVAPVIRRPGSRGVEELADEIAAVADRARAGELTAGDYEGGTFSVSNLGGYGIDAFTPIINPPQVAILGIGALRTVPGFDEGGGVVARRVLTLSLTFDHAFVDGAPAAEYLRDLCTLLEQSGG